MVMICFAEDPFDTLIFCWKIVRFVSPEDHEKLVATKHYWNLRKVKRRRIDKDIF